MQIVKFQGEISNIDLMRCIRNTEGAKLIKYISFKEKAHQPKIDEDDYKARFQPKGPKHVFTKKLFLVGTPVTNWPNGAVPSFEEILK